MSLSDASGEFSGFERYKLILGDKWSEASQYSVSLHEFAHRELEMTTVYGQVHLAYKNILPNEDNWDALLWIDDYFNRQAKFAHETYATWSGAMVMAKLYPEIALDELVTPEYLDYYHLGEHITRFRQGTTLKPVVLYAVISLCFQSERIGLGGQYEYEKLPIETFQSFDFPDNRFQYLLENFSSEFFKNEAAVFVSSCADPELQQLLVQMQGNLVNDEDIPLKSRMQFTGGLRDHFYNCLSPYFNKLGSRSLPKEALAGVINGMYQKIHELTEDAGPIEPVAFYEPDSIEEFKLRIFEEEEMVFKPVPLPARIFPPDVFTEDLKNRLLRKPGDVILITVKHINLLSQDFVFKEDIDQKWLKEHDGVIVYTLINVDQVGVEYMWLVPFRSVAEITEFLKDLPFKFHINTIMHQHALAVDSFMENAFEELMEISENWCFFCEQSPMKLIAGKFFNTPKSIFYSELGLFIDKEYRWIGIVFEVTDEFDTRHLFALPLSSMHQLMLSLYLEKQKGFTEKKLNEMISPADRSMLDFIFYNLYKTHSFKYMFR